MALYMSAFTAVFEKKVNTDMLKGTDESFLTSLVDWHDSFVTVKGKTLWFIYIEVFHKGLVYVVIMDRFVIWFRPVKFCFTLCVVSPFVKK